MRAFQIVVLLLGGLGFVAFGLGFLIAPLESAQLAGLVLTGPAAASELMAFYGGMELAVGGLICACALSPPRRRDGLLLMVAVYALIGVARGIGMLSTGASTPFLTTALVLELGLATLAVAALAGAARGR